MHLNRNLRAAIKAMSDEELSTKYALMMSTTTQGGGLLKPQDLHYELVLRLGIDEAKAAIERAHEVLRMVGAPNDFIAGDPSPFK